MNPIYLNRKDVARQLGEKLAAIPLERPMVLGIPPGGIILALELSKMLEADVDILVIRQLVSKEDPELVLGAVGPEGVIALDRNAVERSRLSEEDVEQITAKERTEMRRRVRYYRGEDEMLNVKDRDVLIVDDAFVNGTVAMAAIRAVHTLQAGKIILAGGFCSSSIKNLVSDEVFTLVCNQTVEQEQTISDMLQRFETLSEEDIQAILEGSPLNRNRNGTTT